MLEITGDARPKSFDKNWLLFRKEQELFGLCHIDGHHYFAFIFSGCLPDDKRVQGFLDTDGLPPIGVKLETGNPYYW